MSYKLSINFFAILLFLIFTSPINSLATTLFSSRHEIGNFSEYTSTLSTSGNLSVSAASALAGSQYGLSVHVDGSNRQIAFKQFATASNTGVVRARFYVDPNSLNMPDLSQVSLIFFVNSGGTENFALMKLIKIGGQYNLRGVMIDDNGLHQETQAWPISDGPHLVEIKTTRSTSPTASDGSYQAWIDGEAKTVMTGVNSYNRYKDFKTVSLGLNGISGTITGTYYLDELVVNDDGTYIGPRNSTTNPTPTPSPTQFTGDANNNQIVDGLDYIIWLNHYNKTGFFGPTSGDFNSNGVIDGLDYIIWVNTYGK